MTAVWVMITTLSVLLSTLATPQELICLKLVRHLPGDSGTLMSGASPAPGMGTAARPAEEGSNAPGTVLLQGKAHHRERGLLHGRGFALVGFGLNSETYSVHMLCFAR